MSEEKRSAAVTYSIYYMQKADEAVGGCLHPLAQTPPPEQFHSSRQT